MNTQSVSDHLKPSSLLILAQSWWYVGGTPHPHFFFKYLQTCGGFIFFTFPVVMFTFSFFTFIFDCNSKFLPDGWKLFGQFPEPNGKQSTPLLNGSKPARFEIESIIELIC